MSIGLKIKELRRAKNLSAASLGESIGLTSQAIYQYENGKTKPSLEIIEKIAKEFGRKTSQIN